MAQTEIFNALNLRVGEWVEVRSKEEILSTLDKCAQLGAMPFMPEMFQYCGQRHRVYRRAHKTCDPVNGLGGRRMENAVHLEGLRCGGEAHGGCQAGCLFYWKESWLKRVGEGQETVRNEQVTSQARDSAAQNPECQEEDVWAGTTAPRSDAGMPPEEPTYVCQATRVSAATTALPWWDMRQYIEDYRSGNVGLAQIASSVLFFFYNHAASAGLGIGSALRLAYDAFQRLRGGTVYPMRMGKIGKGQRTPTAKLDLQPGEMVRMKSYAQILETLDEGSRNRGMYFDAEMVPYCEKTLRVLQRVERIIDEKTGKMIKLKNDAIILENLICQARYARCRKFCPRSYYQYAREIWLERIPSELQPPTS